MVFNSPEFAAFAPYRAVPHRAQNRRRLLLAAEPTEARAAVSDPACPTWPATR